ncbi:MAG: glycosyltransferase, partial [Mailhella sp.]
MSEDTNHTASYELTILVPVYNEEDNMPALTSRLAFFLSRARLSSCVLFINDGSSDSSGLRIREVCAEHEGFFFLEFSRNCGLSNALKAGIDNVYSPYVAYIDADLQTAPEELDLLTPYLDEYELVTGVRAKRKDTGFKKIQSR